MNRLSCRLARLEQAARQDVPAVSIAVVEQGGRVTQLLMRDGTIRPAPAGMTAADLRGPVKLIAGFDLNDL